jgi:hypothetical protein
MKWNERGYCGFRVASSVLRAAWSVLRDRHLMTRNTEHGTRFLPLSVCRYAS